MPQFLIMLAAHAMALIERFHRWLTFRRVLGIVALLILLLCVRGFIEMGMGADLPFLFGLDWGMALEISALMTLLSAQRQVMMAAYVARRWLLRPKPTARFLRRAVRRAIHSRSTTQHLPPPPDDRPEWAFA